MEIFHYVADQLKEVCLFEVLQGNEARERTGSIYNDVDNEKPFADSQNSQVYSFTEVHKGSTTTLSFS